MRGTGFVEELVIRAAFVVPFTSDDCCMFFGSDRSLSVGFGFWAMLVWRGWATRASRDRRPGCEVVADNAQRSFRSRERSRADLRQWFAQAVCCEWDRMLCCEIRRAQRSWVVGIPCVAISHHGLPRARDHLRVVRGQVGAGEVEIESRLAMRFVHRI